MRFAFLTALIMLGFANNASAQMTGNDWKEYCTAREQTPKFGVCMGFFSGTLDGIRLMQKTTGTVILCEPPTSLTFPQLATIIRRYLNEHPQELHLAAASLIPSIVNHAFPCK